MQYLCTLAISDGFKPEEIFKEIKTTYCYREITEEEWEQIITIHNCRWQLHCNNMMNIKKLKLLEGIYKIKNRRIAMRHRMHIGTIVSDR